MAKQNTAQSFADETQQNEKTKETVQKKTENREKQKQGKKRKNRINLNVAIWLIPAAITLIDILYALWMFFWSKEIGKSSVYLDFVAEMMVDVAMLIIELLLLIGTVFLIFNRKNKGACVAVSFIVGVILYGLLAVNIKVTASINADKEKPVVESMEEMLKVLSRAQNQAAYKLQQYILEEDLFMENLDLYCGIPDNDISQEERPSIMAEIILTYLKSNVVDTSEKKLPYNYQTNVLMGNVLYDSFYDLKEESEKPENVSIKNKIYDYALNMLDEATNCRIEADNSLHTAGNRRLIGVYNIDAGVFHQSIGEIDSAVVCYENAAEWAIKSIYSAAIENNMKAMNDAWNVLNIAADKLEEVEGSSDGDSVQKVKNIRDAYKIVIDQWK